MRLLRKNSTAKDVLPLLFRPEEVAMAERIVERERNASAFLSNLAPSDIANLSPVLTSLRRVNGLGRTGAYDTIRLAQTLHTVQRSSEVPLDFTGMTPKEARKALRSYLINNSASTFSYTFSLQGSEYTILFGSSEMVQRLSLEARRNCFSEGGIRRRFVEAYLKSDDISYAVILDPRQNVIGGFTIGSGYVFDKNKGATDQTISYGNRGVAILSRVYSNGITVPDSTVKGAMNAYVLQSGEPTKFVTSGKLLIKLPENISHIYEDVVVTGKCIEIPNQGEYYQFPVYPTDSKLAMFNVFQRQRIKRVLEDGVRPFIKHALVDKIVELARA